MKPTRNIVKPNTGMWNAKRKVWFQKNQDYDITNEELERQQERMAKKELSKRSRGWLRHNQDIALMMEIRDRDVE
jgi:hypothetical protein